MKKVIMAMAIAGAMFAAASCCCNNSKKADKGVTECSASKCAECDKAASCDKAAECGEDAGSCKQCDSTSTDCCK